MGIKRSFLQKRIFRRLVFVNMVQALALSLTGIIDCAVVGQADGARGLAAMKLAMPVFAILSLFDSVLSSGMSVRIAYTLGQGKKERANQIFQWACIAAAAVSLLLFVVGVLFSGLIAAFFTVSMTDREIFEGVRGYLIPILAGAFPIILYSVLCDAVALDGAEQRITISSVVIFVVDIAGDYIAIRLGSGLFGIAVASVAAYTAACLTVAGHFLSGKTMFRLLKPRDGGEILSEILSAGAPMIVDYVCMFLCPIIINYLMMRYGNTDGLAALSIQDAVHYLPESFCTGIFTTVLLMTGMIAAERNKEALVQQNQEIFSYSMGGGVSIAAAIAYAAPTLIRLFTRDPALQDMSLRALRWFLAGVPLACISYAAVAFYQGFGKRRLTELYLVLDNLVLPVAAAAILGYFTGIEGIYASFFVCRVAMVLILLLHQCIVKLTGGQFVFDKQPWEKATAEISAEITTVEQVTGFSEEIRQLCLEHGIAGREAYQIALCAEELGVNSIQHGFSGRGRHHVESRFAIGQRYLILRIRDNCRPYDLKERYRLLNPAESEDPASHIGLRIVFGTADEVNYSHALNLNNICVRVARNKTT